MDVIVSYPFSGALYAFFTEQERGEKLPDDIGHGYYRTLYGKNHAEVRDLALTQLLMYDKVFIVPADCHLPLTKNYSSGDDYANKELGLYTSWELHHQLYAEIEDQVNKDLEDPVISRILTKVRGFAKNQILTDTRMEIALANKYNCPILSSGGRSTIIRRLSEIDASGSSAGQVNPASIIATEAYIDVSGLSFNPTNYDLLYAYKQDKEVRAYATAFRHILQNIEDPKTARIDLLRLLRDSMARHDLLRKTSGVFDISSILLSVAGFIPGIGMFFSGGALAATGLSKFADEYAKRTWYELGPRIQKVTDFKKIEKAIEKELKSS